MEFNTDRDLRRHHDGHRGHEGLARQPRGDRRLDRAGRARPPLRRASSRSSRLRQDDPRRASWRSRASTCPASMLYGGSIAPGRFQGTDVTIQDVFEAVGAHAAGQDDATRSCTSSRTSPAPAPAPAAASSPPTRWRWRCEFLGHLADGQRRCVPATDQRKDAGRPSTAGELVMDVLRARPAGRATSSRATAFENAIAGVAPRGGSTNAVLHLLALAREAGRARSTSTTSTASARATPLLADLKPGGRFVAADLYRGRRHPRSSRSACVDAGLLARRARSPSPAARIGEEAATRRETPGQEVVRPLDDPLKPTRRPRHPARQPRARGLRREGRRPRAHATTAGPARVFDSEEDALRGGHARQHQGRRRRRHPLRGAARRPRHARDARASPPRIVGAGLGDTVALSPTAASPARRTASWPGHVAPEAARGGPIAAVRDGDIDRLRRATAAGSTSRSPTTRSPARLAELARRRRRATRRGVMAKYAQARVVGRARRGDGVATGTDSDGQ